MPLRRFIRCCCERLEELTENPRSPVRFDAELNEYHIVDSNGGQSMIRFCPWCGRKTPKSRRDRLFHKIPHIEQRRLVELTKNLRTLDEVFAAFGQPEFDAAGGITVTTPERRGKPENTQSY